MSHLGDRHLICIKRSAGRVVGVRVFEYVAINGLADIQVHVHRHSQVFKIRIITEDRFDIHAIDSKENPFYAFSWYEEKFVCDDSWQMYEWANRYISNPEILKWFARRL